MTATPQIPHMRIVIVFCLMAVLGYAGFSIYVLGYIKDAAMTGDVIGTWKSFAVAAFTFWVGSSSAGKARDAAAGDPQPVTVTNDTDNPVPVETKT